MTTLFNLDFQYASGKPQSSADFRAMPEDFVVNEVLGFEPSGEGEHLLLSVTKISQNTHWVAQQLANFFKIKAMDVGYCGRKDRHAVTTQWFSLYLPNPTTVDWKQCEIEGVTIHSATRHQKKLRPGDHKNNSFVITLRNLKVEDQLEQRLQSALQGVPNYFGEQRFGFDGGNLLEGDLWANKEKRISNRKQRGLIISALRSYLFNRVLSTRVRDGDWKKKVEGDVDIFNDIKNSEPTGPLWGRGRPIVNQGTAELEGRVLEPFENWCRALEHCGLSQERRLLVSRPINFDYQLTEDLLTISFSLPPGEYATTILREIIQLQNCSLSRNEPSS